MSIISLPYQLTDGTTADAAQVMSNYNVIVNDYNGNITNANLSSTIAITDSKLNQIQTAGKVNGTALTNFAGIPSGAGVIPAANLIYSNVQYPYVKCSNTQSSGVNGGAGTTGAWETYPLNTQDNDTQSISTFSGNQITLPSGTYRANASVLFYQTGVSQIRIYNVTGSTILINGITAGASTGNLNTTEVGGLFTLNTSSTVALQYQIQTHNATTDLGLPGSYGTEVYGFIELTKVL